MPRNLVLAAAVLIFLALSAQGEQIILCGWDTVFVVDTAKDTAKPIWSWNAKQCDPIPEAMRGTFATTDDCKPVDGGARILIAGTAAPWPDRRGEFGTRQRQPAGFV